jgi:hypothetical protein
MTCERVCVLVDVDEGNNEGVCDDVLGYGKIVTVTLYAVRFGHSSYSCGQVGQFLYIPRCPRTMTAVIPTVASTPPPMSR